MSPQKVQSELQGRMPKIKLRASTWHGCGTTAAALAEYDLKLSSNTKDPEQVSTRNSTKQSPANCQTSHEAHKPRTELTASARAAPCTPSYTIVPCNLLRIAVKPSLRGFGSATLGLELALKTLTQRKNWALLKEVNLQFPLLTCFDTSTP